jgi:outer membrane murein-binding lipoprotein Lpp
MKLKHLIVCSLIGVTLFLGGCSGGVTKDEYNALSSKYTALEKQYNEMQQQYNAIKAESDDKLKKAKEYDERLTAANAWALFFDIYTDIFRYNAGIPTKYGYAGAKFSQAFIDEFVIVASEAGGTEFAERINNAFSLPVGKEKDKAWADFYVKLAEGMLAATTK